MWGANSVCAEEEVMQHQTIISYSETRTEKDLAEGMSSLQTLSAGFSLTLLADWGNKRALGKEMTLHGIYQHGVIWKSVKHKCHTFA